MLICLSEKRIEVGLTYVYGIGQSTADENPRRHRDQSRISGSKISSADDEAKIRDYIDKHDIIVEGDLRRNVALDIKRLD